MEEQQGFVDEFTSVTLDPIWTPFGVGGNRTVTPTVNGLVLADTVGDGSICGVTAPLSNVGMRRVQFKIALKYTIPPGATATNCTVEIIDTALSKKVSVALQHSGGWTALLKDFSGTLVSVGGPTAETHVCAMFDPTSGAVRMSYRVFAYDADSGWPGDTAGWTPAGTYYTVAVGNLPIIPQMRLIHYTQAGNPTSVTLRGLKLRYI